YRHRRVPGCGGGRSTRGRARGGVLLARSPRRGARRDAAACAHRDPRGAPWVPARVSRLQPRPPCRARGGDPRHAHPPPPARADSRRIHATPGDRRQDGRPARAGRDGVAPRLRAAGAPPELTGLPTEVAALARDVDRGVRSGVGTWTFAHGGFVLEGGRADHAEGVAPLLAHLAFPAAWRCIVAVPRGKPGLAGDQ